MRGFEASAVIAADPAAIWTVLTDGPGWTRWDSAVVRLDGTIGPSFERFVAGLKRQAESVAA
jgi:hypothetical protein